MSNGNPTISAGQIPRKPTYWDDLQRVTRIEQPDLTFADAVASILYASNGLPWPGVTMQSAAFSRSSTGTVVAAVSGHTIRVYAVKLICDAATVVKWQYDPTGIGATTDIEGAQSIVAGGGYVESVEPPAFLFETFEDADLVLNVSGGGTAAGRVSYWAEAAS